MNKIACQHCQIVLPIPTEYQGRKVRCPKCTQTFIVPAPANDATQEYQAGHPTLDSVPLKASPQQASYNAKASVPTKSSNGARLGNIGRFELREVLGQGGFGRVYRAYDPQLDREVALKVPTFGPHDKHKIQRFLTEAKAAAGLRHPHIVPTFESGQVDGQYFIVVHFVKGQPLAQAIKQSLLPREQAVRIVVSVARALAYAHHEGIVHRDVKPDNIMLDARGEPQLMDFGMAKRLNEDAGMTTEGTLMGTPAYMSPEQARGEMANVGPTSDQYAVGTILYEVLCGQRAFQGPPHSVLAQILSQEPQPLRSLKGDVPRDLEAITQKAMCKEAAGRYPSCGAMADDLERWLRGEPTYARPATLVERWARWSRRNKTLATLSTATAAVILVAIVGISAAWVKTDAALSDAVEQRQRADEKATEAARQTKLAQEQKQRADEKAEEAAKQTQLVAEEKTRADEKANEAARQAKIATKEKERAEQSALKIAQTAYTPLIQTTFAAYELGNLDHAGAQFRKITARSKGWEYQYLANCISIDNSLTVKNSHEKIYNIKKSKFLPNGKSLLCNGVVNENERTEMLEYDLARRTYVRTFVTHTKLNPRYYGFTADFWINSSGTRILSYFFPTNELVVLNYADAKILDQQILPADAPGVGDYKGIYINKSCSEATICYAGTDFRIDISEIGKIAITKNARHESCVKLDDELKLLLKNNGQSGYMVFMGRDDAAVYSDGRSVHYFIAVQNGKVIKTPISLPAHIGKINCAALNSQGDELTLGCENQIAYVWDFKRAEVIQQIKIHYDSVEHACYSPQDDFLLTEAGGIRISKTSWRNSSANLKLEEGQELLSMMTSRDDAEQLKFYVVTKDDKLYIKESAAGKIRSFQPKNSEKLMHVAWSKDGTYYGGFDPPSYSIEIYRVDDDRLPIARIKELGLSNGRLTLTNKFFESRLGGIAFDVSEKIVIANCSDKFIHNAYDFNGKLLWSIRSGMRHRPPTIDASGRAVAIDDGLTRLVGLKNGSTIDGSETSSQFLAFANKTLQCIGYSSKIPRTAYLNKISFHGHSADITHAIFTNDDSRVFTGSQDGTVRLWDTSTGEEMLTLCDFGEPVGGICLAKDGTLLIAASATGKLRYFDAAERKPDALAK
jgi:WD40 repeat protein